MSREGFAVDKEFLSEDSFESFTINRVLLLTLNLITFLGLVYFALVLILNADSLYRLYEAIPIDIYQAILTILLAVTVFINSKLIRANSEDWKALLIITSIYFFLSLIHGVLLYQNPTTINYASLSISGVLTQAEFWMIFFYPLVILFYILPIVAYIQVNQTIEDNIKFSLTLFLGSFGLMLYTQGSKIWNTTGWRIPVITYNQLIIFEENSTLVTGLSNFNISVVGYLMIIISMLLFIAGVVILLRGIQDEPNSINTLIPYLFLILIITIDYVFAKLPIDLKLFSTGLIIIWFIIGGMYTVAYTLIPNSILNSQLTDKSKFTPNIMSRFHDKKIETQILDTIEENQIKKLIEISSFLGLPYHKVLKSLKNLILQGYISGRILNQQFIPVAELQSFEQSYLPPEFPSPFEIWKISMRNEGVISVEDLSAIMSIDSNDLKVAFERINLTQENTNNLIEEYIYIQSINELDSLYSQILAHLPQPDNSQPLNTE